MSRMPYRPEIDGLRALAVVPVILFHTGLRFSGGYVGVDIFFVISGFLITSLILADIQAGTFSLATFWERRIRRIAPAAVATVLACVVVGYFLLLPRDFAELGQSVIAQSLMVANFFFHQTTGYFDGPAAAKPLLHYWSLAVEEQFYILFPPLLVWLFRRGATVAFRVVALLALASFAWSIVGVRYYQSATFFLLPGRVWELALGALLALVRCEVPVLNRARAPLGWIGLGLMGLPMLVYDHSTPFPGLAAVPPCLGAALVIWSTNSGPSLLRTLLSLRPVVFIGLISYSLYLWHWPLQVYSNYWRVETSPTWMRLCVVGATGVLAYLSWRFVELPFRRRRQGVAPAKRRHIGWAMAAATAAMIAVGAGLWHRDGLPRRLPPETLQFAAAYDDRPNAEEADVSTNQVVTRRIPELHRGAPDAPIVLLWGDSHARVVSPAIEMMCRDLGLTGYRISLSRTPSLLAWGDDDMRRHNEAVVDWIKEHQPDLVIFASRWDNTLLEPGDGEALAAAIEAVEATGAAVWIMRQVPFQGLDVPRALAGAALRGNSPSSVGITVDRHQRFMATANALIDRAIEVGQQVTVVDPLPHLSEGGFCFSERNGTAIYYDRQHLTDSGARLLGPLFTDLALDFLPQSPTKGRRPLRRASLDSLPPRAALASAEWETSPVFPR